MEHRFHPIADRVLVAIFLVTIAAPAVSTIAGVDVYRGSDENRTAAPFPAIAWELASLRRFPDEFTRYFEDNFAFRAWLVRAQAAFRLTALGASPSPAVIRGRDGWLFYAEDGALEDYATAPPFTREELEHWRETLQDTHRWLSARGIRYLFVISPDKHQVYPEFMPGTIRRRAPSRIDQLVAYLADQSDVPVLDLRPALREAKKRERIYHRTDTHWNDRGGYVAYRTILASLAGAGALQPVPRAMFREEQVRTRGRDLAGMLGLTDVLGETDLRLTPRRPRAAHVVEPRHSRPHGMEARFVTEMPDAGLPRAVIFRDSFATGLIPFLSEHFSRAVYLWQYNVDPEIVSRERADVVIQEWVGRRLSTLSPYNPFRDEEGAIP